MTRLVLHIDRLVLRGLGRVDAAAAAGALQAELQRLLAADAGAALRAQAGAPVLRAGLVRLPAGTDAGALGQALAARIAAPTASSAARRSR